MKKTWLKTASAGLAIALAAGTMYLLVRAEPSYEGKTVREWLVQFDSNAQEAANAFRQMGPEALPYLMRELRVRDTIWKRKLVALTQIQPFIGVSFTSGHKRRSRAIKACAALGPLAKPAIPALGEALGQGSSSALGVLKSFGDDAIPALTQALTNAPGCGAPYGTARVLKGMGARARMAVPNLIWEFEHYWIGAPRTASARALTAMCWELMETENQFYCEEVVLTKAAFIRGLSNSNDWVRCVAADSLGVFKYHAREATLPLLALLDDPSPKVRQAATNALQAIEPEAIALADTDPPHSRE